MTASWGRSQFPSCGGSCLPDSHRSSHRGPALPSGCRCPMDACLKPNSATERDRRMLTLHGPHRTAHPAALRILCSHIPGIRRRRGETKSGREREQRYSSSSPLPSGPLCCYPCPNLTFIGKSIHPGGPLSNLPENTMGEGQL